ncbi:unnamed protein product [Cylindrotheca closterium]|uniref:Uncharacterized protein n=1 Tax=Cylindrotheca closterium TaxID=2856 RepID=A0AAD2GCK7_9STRA|nr:unnamed protein product [Cylindrotheca closterium]
MHSTRVILGRGAISTHHGQKRILKHSTPDLVTYIRKAVQTGIYRSNEEIEEMNQHLKDDPTDLKRIRWHVPRGSKIHDYPAEYEILSLNPPSPFKPFMPKKDVRKAVNKYMHEHRPTDRLANNYLNRILRGGNTGEPGTAEEYYRRLLGSSKAPKVDSAMGSKSAMLNKAYAVAVKQYQLMRTEDLGEKEALYRVEELLKQSDYEEKTRSRLRAKSLDKHNLSDEHAEKRAQAAYPAATPFADQKENMDTSMLYSDNQRSFEGMISWTHRLQAVPYRQWTVGASTALDHWIAKRVLGMSEETWLELLEGDSPHLIGRGRDIVVARHALFPETALDEDDSITRIEDDVDIVEDDLDALLATLGGWNDDADSATEVFSSTDEQILGFTKQLQVWRTKQAESPFEAWSEAEKSEFNTWLKEYVTALAPDSDMLEVNMGGTRNALLLAPPLSHDDSTAFWENIRDETAAEVFLQLLHSQKTTSSHPFWQLEYDLQLERLVELGSIHEIADEYAKESDRSLFLSRYGDYLLEGLELDHLAPDATGPIRGSDLGDALMKKYKIAPSDRFHLKSIKYGTDEFGTPASQRARDIFRSWNTLKTGRAHYEEKLFQKGLLGLSYSKKEG